MTTTIHKLQKHESDAFTVVDNETFRAICAVDAVAAAIWVYLQGKPNDWIVRAADVQRACSIGRDRYRKACKVLKEIGVFWITQPRDESGLVFGTVIHVSCKPVMVSDWQTPENTGPEHREPEKPSPGSTEGLKNRRSVLPTVGESVPLQKKDSLQKKDITKRKVTSTRSRSFTDDLMDRSWAKGL